MFPFLSLTETERESVLKLVGTKEKFALMRCDQYFREYVFKFGPWPPIVQQVVINQQHRFSMKKPRKPKRKGQTKEQGEYIFGIMKDSYIIYINAENEFGIGIAFYPKTVRKDIVLTCKSGKRHDLFYDLNYAAAFSLIGKIKSCGRVIVEYKHDAPDYFMVEQTTKLLQCLGGGEQRVIDDLLLECPLPVIRQFVNGLNAKIVNSCIISLPFLSDLNVGARKDVNREEIDKIRKYFAQALQKPIFTHCRLFATDNVLDMFADGLKMTNFKIIYSQESTMEGFWPAIETLLTKGPPNDEALTVLSTGYCYGAAYKKRAYSEYNLNRYTTKIARKYGLEKIESDSDEAKMMLELVADPTKNDCSCFEAWKWQKFRRSKNFPFEFSKKAKFFYKKRIESTGKTLLMMASLHDVFNGCETLVYLFKYLSIIEVILF